MSKNDGNQQRGTQRSGSAANVSKPGDERSDPATPEESGDNRRAGDTDSNASGGSSKSKGASNPADESTTERRSAPIAEEPQELDNQSFGRPEAADIDPEHQGISNRPGDEDPDSGVDREPGEPQVDEAKE